MIQVIQHKKLANLEKFAEVFLSGASLTKLVALIPVNSQADKTGERKGLKK
jgi:hypothetical protein